MRVASHTLISLINSYKSIRMPLDLVPKIIGTERQTVTLVLSSADGCQVELGESRRATPFGCEHL